MNFFRPLGCALMAMTWGASVAHAAAVPEAPGARMDFGSLVHYFVEIPTPTKQVVGKAIAIRLGAEAGVCFDAESMRFAAGWTGGFIDMGTTNVVRVVQGVGAAPIVGKLAFSTKPGPGCDRQGDFADPRPNAFGPLPDEWASYRGLYRHGDQVVLCYSIGECELRESPGIVTVDGVTVFTRSFQAGKSTGAHELLICEVDGAGGGVGPRSAATPASAPSASADSSLAVLDHALGGEGLTLVGVSEAPKGATLRVDHGRILLKLPALAQPARFTVAIAAASGIAFPALAAALAKIPASSDLAALCAGGPSRWPALTTVGRRGPDDWAYAVDSVALPSDNPWRSWMRPTALDFFSDGRAAVATLGGDVWLVSGLDEQLAKVSWKRYATGLFEPLGLRIVDDVVYVLARDQIVRLKDLDGDGEADFYESFNHAGTVWPKYNDFAFDLQTDRAGNFYYAKGGHGSPVDVPWHACICKVSKDGRHMEAYATGLRAPNGMGMGPNDELTVSDNQGNWIPASKINLVKKGGWYGFVGNPAFYGKNTPKAPEQEDPPLCWIPMPVDNSSGGEVWAPAEGWGPLSGHMLHLSYGQSSLMAVLYEMVGGQAQGGVMRLPLRFESGIMRGRFNPKDGQLYVCGIKGWQTNAGLDGCLQRVRFTGKKACLAISLQVGAKGITIAFNAPLERASVDAQNVSIEQWNYAWTAAYGSPDFSVADPKRKGHDQVEVKSAKLGADGRSVLLDIGEVKPVMQMAIKLKFKDAEGAPVEIDIHNTINSVAH